MNKERMNRLKTVGKVFSIVFLLTLIYVVCENYVNPCPPPTTIFVDTCKVDSIIVDSIKLASDDTAFIDALKKP